MSHSTLTAEIEDWLLGKALIDPDILILFEKLCQRLRAIGIPLDRTALSWPVLHPLFRAEQVFWYPDKGAELEQYYHSTAGNEHWLKSPFYHAQTNNLETLRRTLVGENAMLDFDVFDSFVEQGYTDYLLTRTNFKIAEVEHFSGGATGMMTSWMTMREGGFTDDDLAALKHIQKILAVAVHAAIQKRVMSNLANAYLGPTAGWKVLAGEIKRGDGERIPAVVWFSDLRGSTRLSDTMDGDSYLALLNRYFECTAGPVIEHGGEILNFIGDGVLAIFPIEADCPMGAVAKAEKAVRDAMRLREEAIETGTPGNAPLDFGIGLAIGDVMYGNIGVPARLAFSGIGKIVNTVQRVEAATKSTGIPVLALKKFAEAAPGNWEACGRVDISDLDRQLDVFTLPEVVKHVSLPSSLSVEPAE
ncbi:MAG: adenylate/guanylate cyclase domain-containing protein [Pseudomonadota bacterium]